MKSGWAPWCQYSASVSISAQAAMYWQRGRLLLGREFDDVRASNRCTAEVNDAVMNVSKGSIAPVRPIRWLPLNEKSVDAEYLRR